MSEIRLTLEDQVVTLIYPTSLERDIEAIFGKQRAAVYGTSHTMVVQEDGPGQFALKLEGKTRAKGLDRTRCLIALVGEVVQALISDLDSGVAIHSGAVSREGMGLLLPGTTGAGKSCLSGWLADKGFDYLTDECVVLQPETPGFSALPRPLVTKAGMDERLSNNNGGTISIVSGPNAIFWPQNAVTSTGRHSCHLVAFPHFSTGAELQIEHLSAARTALELMACNVNARNLPDHGLGIVTAFARSVPAVTIRYGGFDQLDGLHDTLLKLMSEGPRRP